MKMTRLALVLLALSAPSCSVALRVQRSTKEEVERTPLGEWVRVAAELRQDDVQLVVRHTRRTQLTTYAVETVTRRRGRIDKPSDVVVLDLTPILPVAEVIVGANAMFDPDNDVVLGPLGFLLAVLVPGITQVATSHDQEPWDATTDRREVGSREIEEPIKDRREVVRVVTDHKVFELQLDAKDEAVIPLVDLFGPRRTPGRVTLAHGATLFRLQFDGSAVTCTGVPK